MPLYILLNNMDVTLAEVRKLRDTESVGMHDAQKRLKRENLLTGLAVLEMELGHPSTLTGPEQVLHDLILIVRESLS